MLRLGCRSKTAARRLGLDGLAHLEGGIAAWIEAGLPVVSMQSSHFTAMFDFGSPTQLT